MRKLKTSIEQGKPLADHVESIQAAVLKEFEGSTVPVARINYFAVYRACMQVMWNISEANHDEPQKGICKCPAEFCLRECNDYLQRCQLAGGKRHSRCARRKTTDSCLQIISERFGGTSVDDFLWDVSLR